ncbi:hypothetical protein [Novosphingobium rosa]|uniref:hypothetical protein n=1 Tax=Novosphingobium rosa TaxID=76978 RepID=UPI00082F68DE|nr:hypothetical protein [Novosphingobium rosa]
MDARHLALHGLAIKRYAGAEAVAELTGLSPASAEAQLAQALATGRAVETRGAFSLTPLARVALQASYDRIFAPLREDKGFAEAYHGFERINPDLKQVITDWQTIELRGERRANDHSDQAYDDRVIDRLGTLHERAEPVLSGLASALPRMAIYGRKLEAALDRAEGGDIAWVSDIHRDSYHTVWFELHEDLLRIMGRERVE